MPNPVINEQLEQLNHLISHQNAAIDLLASDKRAAMTTNIADIAMLCKNGEIMELMDYGDQISMAWADGETNYTPALNLCHESDELLEDAESIHGAFFEWDKTLPYGTQFDAPEAIYYFDGTEAAGTYHIEIGSAYGNGWLTTKAIQFTLTDAPAADDQLVIDCATSADTDPTNGRTWNVYGKGSTTSKQSGTTSDGTGGTKLGSTSATDGHHTNGRVNAPSRVVYGYNRWSQSGLRQFLNSAAAANAWWTPQNPWDRPHALAATKAGFLAGYDASVVQHFKPIKVVTVACNADSNAEDVTYDKVFLRSLEQMYVSPMAAAGKEGVFWEYYKRLLGRTSPAPAWQTYTRLIKYALEAPTSAHYCWCRSANLNYANYAMLMYSSGYVYNSYAVNANRCAPSVFISE